MLTREKVSQKLNELVKNQNLVKHCLAVEAVLLAYANHFGIKDENERREWSIVGLIHDADWEKYPSEHPQVILEWLQEQDASESLLNAVAAHGFNFGVEPKTLMARCLRAVDELTGLIVAVTLVHPSKRLAEVTVQSILRKWHGKGFAKGVNRAEIERGAAEIGVPLEEHIQIVLSAMQGISDELGL